MQYTREPIYRVGEVTFYIPSYTDILQNSTCNVTATKSTEAGDGIYSLKMGTIESGVNCKTCFQDVHRCAGHHGHIILHSAKINVTYKEFILSLLKCFCHTCHTFLLQDKFEELARATDRINEASTMLKNIHRCLRCSTDVRKYHFNDIYIVDDRGNEVSADLIYNIFKNIPRDVFNLLGLKENSHPKNTIMRALMVPPPCVRPYVCAGACICDDEISSQVQEIIKNTNTLALETLTAEKRRKCEENVSFRINTMLGNGSTKVQTMNGGPIRPLRQRITGKDGQIRNSILGKRCDMSARSVVSPDPTLKLDEIGVPRYVANILTFPEIVTPYNIVQLQEMLQCDRINYIYRNGVLRNVSYAKSRFVTSPKINDVILRKGYNGKMRTINVVNNNHILRKGDRLFRQGKEVEVEAKKHDMKLEIGDIAHRKLRNGDLLLFNRQPTLHKTSMMAARAVIFDNNKSFRINLALTKTTGMDFDGDEVTIHAPQSYEAKCELDELCKTTKHIISGKNGEPCVVVVQDSLIGMYYISRDDKKMDRGEFFDIISHIDDTGTKLQQYYNTTSKDIFLGKHLIFFMLPNGYNFKKDDICIENGLLTKGVLTKPIINGNNGIIKDISFNYSMKDAETFINNLQFISVQYLTKKGFTVHLADCTQSLEYHNIAKDLYKQSIQNIDEKVKTIHHDIVKENFIMNSLQQLTNKTMKTALDYLKEDNSFLVSERSGAKGSIFNIAQITASLGQQMLAGTRMEPLTHISSNEYEAKGYVYSSFYQGLNLNEFVAHNISARESVCDTTSLTPVSGYNQRCASKILDDYIIRQDYTVTNGKRCIQYIFGLDGYDLTHTMKVDGHNQIANVPRLISILGIEGNDKIPNVDEILGFIKKRRHIPDFIEDSIYNIRKEPLKKQLLECTLDISKLSVLEKELERRYYSALMVPGECVGIMSAQYMGECSTQATLDTFHTAGSITNSLVSNSLSRAHELNQVTKNPKLIVYKIYFTQKFTRDGIIKNFIVENIIFKFSNFLSTCVVRSVFGEYAEVLPEDAFHYNIARLLFPPPCNVSIASFKSCDKEKKIHLKYRWRLYLNINECKRCRIHPDIVKKKLEAEYNDVYVIYNIDDATCDIFCTIARYDTLLNTILYGHIDASEYYISEDVNGELYVELLIRCATFYYSKILACKYVDQDRTTTSNEWDVFYTFGIEEARKFYIKELEKIYTNIEKRHLLLRADAALLEGEFRAFSRYPNRPQQGQPLKSIGFEEIMRNAVYAATHNLTDNMTSTTANMMFGQMSQSGTNISKIIMKDPTIV